MSESIYRFDRFELNTSEGELRSNGSHIRLQEKPLRLLSTLLENPQQMVSREELRRRMWPADTYVDFERGINVAMKKVRDALGDSAENPKFIETVAKKGYRFLVSVDVVSRPVGSPGATVDTDAEKPRTIQNTESYVPFFGRHRWMWAALSVGILSVLGLGIFTVRLQSAHRVQIQSLAVLPLRNLSADPNQEYFADGVTEDLITNLAQSLPVRVISRTSVMRYKQTTEPISQIARELGADVIIEGAVARDGNRVTVTIQLINAVEDRHLWAQKYDRRLGDLLDIEAELSKQITSQIGATLSEKSKLRRAKDSAVDPQVYDLYLKGRYFWNKRDDDGMLKAYEYFQKAVSLDPNYAPAYVGLADCYLFGEPPTDPPKILGLKAKAMANKALELDESLGEAHASLGLVAQNFEWDWAEAGRQFRRAIQLNPNYATAHQWYAEDLTLSGNFDEAVEQMKIARELDPLSLIIVKDSGEIYYVARRYDLAIEYFRKALEMEPSFLNARRYLALAYIQKKDFSGAISVLQKVAEQEPSPDDLAELGFAYALGGRRQDAQRALSDLRRISQSRYTSPRDYALIYAGLGDKDRAFAWLDKGYREGAVLVELKVDPRWDSLRDDPRFADLMKRMGFAS
jgi:TolB-like protein/DNA-binding winged helix-turn-helix (wHTH) protein/Tfp pilus assembly protein PilF